jgi:hypothetical protein
MAGLQDEIDAYHRTTRIYLLIIFMIILVTGLMIATARMVSNIEFLGYTLIC